MEIRRIIVASLGVTALSLACQSGSEIASPTPQAGTSNSSHPSSQKPAENHGGGGSGGSDQGNLSGIDSDGDGKNSSTDVGDGDGDGDGDGNSAEGGGPKPFLPIEYPALMLKARGSVICDETLPSTTQIETKLSDSELSINRVDIFVECYKKTGPLGGLFGTKCDPAKFLNDIRAKTLGITRYKRASNDDLEKATKSGLKMPLLAIYAKSATTHTNETYSFDKPLPVFPMPAAKARYAELNAGPMTFTAGVSGRSFQVSVEVRKVGESGDIVKIQMTTSLTGVTDRAVYGRFPLPKVATYQIDTKTRDVRAIDGVTSWFEDEHCEGSGQVVMDYKLCTKTKSGKTDNFSCQ